MVKLWKSYVSIKTHISERYLIFEAIMTEETDSGDDINDDDDDAVLL